MRNKIIALILVLTLMLPFEAAFAKISYDKVPELMQALEFIPSKDTIPEKEITRGEFAKLATKLIAVSDYKNLVEPCKFSDVTQEDECFDAVSLLEQMGIIHGTSDSEFRPNDPIELSHACKILVHIMGYQHLVVNNNYLVVANQKGLLSGVNVEGVTFDHKTALQLIYNTLEADISDYNMVDGVATNDHKIFMTKRLNIYKIKGTVTADGVHSLTSEIKVKDGYVLVGGEILRNETGMNNLVGNTIEGFYKKDYEADENVLVYAFIKDSENASVTLTADDIIDYANNTYTYYVDAENDETAELYVDTNYRLIYNGKLYKAEEALPTFTLTVDQMMTPATGEVKLTDSNADGSYDVISVLDLKSYVVKSIDYDQYRIYGNPKATPGTVELGTAKNSLTIKAPNGEYIDNFEKILVGDIVSVGLSVDGKHAEIFISNNKGTGLIQSADNTSYVIDDVIYDFAPEYVTNIATAGRVEPGKEAEYYLTYENKIIYATKAGESEALYARITGAKVERGLDKTLQLQLYLENNSYDYYGFAKNVTIDGVRYKTNYEDIYNYLFVNNDFSATGEYYGIILVKLNEDNEIYFIDTPYTESVGNPNSATEDDNTLHIIRNGEKKVARWFQQSFSFQGNWIADTDAKFIVVADNSSEHEEDMLFTNVTTADTSNLTNVPSEFMAFSTKANSFVADAVVRVIEKYRGAIKENSEYQVLLKVTDALNKAGETVKKVTVTNGKVIKDYYTASDTSLICQCGSTLCQSTPIVPGPGDIVKFTLNDSNIIEDGGMFVAYDYSEDKQWAYVSEPKHLGSGGVPTKQTAYASHYTRYAVLSGYLNALDFETSQWVIDYLPYRTSETYRGVSVTYGPYENHPLVLSLRDAYPIVVNVNKGTIKPKLTSEITQFNDGLGLKKKCFLLMTNGLPYCIVEYDS